MLIPEFPSQTHAFFWREIQALREMDSEIHIISTKKPDFSKNQHEFSSESENTRYLVPFPIIKTLAFLLMHPIWFAKCLAYCIGLKESTLAEKLKALPFIPAAAHMLMYVDERNITHVHAHSCANSGHLVAMAHLLNGLPYSITVHGNLSEYGKDHAAKMANAKFVSTVTRPLQQEVLDACKDFDAKRVPVITMGVDLNKFSAEALELPSQGPLQLTSVSRLARLKGHSYSLKALASLKNEFDFQYAIVGDGDTRAPLEEEVAALGLKVKFLELR